MNHLVVVLALVGALAWGFWAFFADIATRSMAPEAAMVVSYSVGIGVASLYILYRGTSVLGNDPTAIGFAALAGVASGIGAVAYYGALQAGAAGIATTVTAMYFVVAAVLGVAFLGDSLAASDVAGIAAAVVAVALIAY
ncbi:EamA family transporter [Halorubrum sp. JWXQ-INN 858]|uniref:EamA family transporter n=1 Tax=Halorubrum sp. JWXQ-INN 858 TaxID=2690782 RepID=UPI001356C030|nr:EamA family transporter [Halorubrum sp. JWXQ-INN 858]MWV64861.1 EamA family transporter [Halorubrum sp. JWXQ-INN 858]